jgi:hypothetical protein
MSNLKKEWYRYLIEILVVILGIMGAFTLESWRELRKEHSVRQELYRDFIQELATDMEDIQGNAEFNKRYLKSYERASEIILNDSKRKLMDSLGIISMGLMEFSDFKKNGSAYEMLSSNGKLNLINNTTILNQLQEIAIKYNYINRIESNQETLLFDVVPQVAKMISFKPFKVMQPEVIYGYEMNNIFQIYIKLGQEKDGLYKEAIAMLRDLMSAMENELTD